MYYLLFRSIKKLRACILFAFRNLHRAVIMYNNPCDNNCGGFSRTFIIDWDTSLESHDHRAILPAFYDLWDNVSVLFSYPNPYPAGNESNQPLPPI